MRGGALKCVGFSGVCPGLLYRVAPFPKQIFGGPKINVKSKFAAPTTARAPDVSTRVRGASLHSSSSRSRCSAFLLCDAESLITKQTAHKRAFPASPKEAPAPPFQRGAGIFAAEHGSEVRRSVNNILIHSFGPPGENGGSFTATRDGKLRIYSWRDNASGTI